MKQLRWTGAAITLALVALTTAACSSSSGGGSGKVHLTFWTHTHPPMLALNKALIKEYEAKHPNVVIDYEQIPNTDFNTKMLASLSNGSGPDIINMDDVALRGDYIPKNLLAPLDYKAMGASSQKANEDKYLPGTLAGASGPDGAH